MTAGQQNNRQAATQTETRRAVSDEDRRSCIAIRLEVFVDEQRVPVEDEIDNIDDQCLHYLTRDLASNHPIATARLIPKGNVAKIGRVAVVRSDRGKGVGLGLMLFIIGEAQQMGFIESVLDSQTYAIPFYQRLGYVVEGEEFLDGGIPHYKMRRSLLLNGHGAAY